MVIIQLKRLTLAPSLNLRILLEIVLYLCDSGNPLLKNAALFQSILLSRQLSLDKLLISFTI